MLRQFKMQIPLPETRKFVLFIKGAFNSLGNRSCIFTIQTPNSTVHPFFGLATWVHVLGLP